MNNDPTVGEAIDQLMAQKRADINYVPTLVDGRWKGVPFADLSPAEQDEFVFATTLADVLDDDDETDDESDDVTAEDIRKYAPGIYVRALVDGRWQTVPLADLSPEEQAEFIAQWEKQRDQQ